MIYQLDSASGQELNISWGNFKRWVEFDDTQDENGYKRGNGKASLEDIRGYFNNPRGESYNGKKFIYGISGSSPEEIFAKYIASYTAEGPNQIPEERLKKVNDGLYYFGKYYYSIEINSLEDLNRLIDEFGTLVIDGQRITIYDSYLE